MEINILTLFPEMFDTLNHSIISRAIESSKVNLNIINIRDFSKDKHKRVDDTPYGGGAGMLIKPDVVYDTYLSILNPGKVIYMSPRGKVLTQNKAKELSKEESITIICGHYEGIDQRVIDEIVDEEISIGDYVLTGGELPAMVLVDTVVRYIDGVINNESTEEESHTNGLLEYSQYTRPEVFLNRKVPDVLLSGHHKKIQDWRRKDSIKITLKNRPELINLKELSEEDRKIIEEMNDK